MPIENFNIFIKQFPTLIHFSYNFHRCFCWINRMSDRIRRWLLCRTVGSRIYAVSQLYFNNGVTFQLHRTPSPWPMHRPSHDIYRCVSLDTPVCLNSPLKKEEIKTTTQMFYIHFIQIISCAFHNYRNIRLILIHCEYVRSKKFCTEILLAEIMYESFVKLTQYWRVSI